ncbi:helix-turn-helix domain-containing protein [Pseudochrobactrum kiredjianiae]|uniref:Helix-turn-helix domain-containing protein n=1 Tax=Pseudochrobactrum kiredjianiae TaxID=386305 RepID=A0ABW3V680_9HYPH|nr:helix-turn-helix transcriptional regulator [Pseudochrobactrum kiredjianiae]MDM7849568.1 helix-turn-helix transcriptional regulator [Pseudochrobactrum kiredjianiae]
MTPFGLRLRQLREERGVSQKDMAVAIRVSAAYLSALEHGRRGQPTWDLLQRMIGYLNIIWDEAEELQNLAMISHPRVTIDTAGLSPEATELANLLSNHIHILDKEMIANLSTMLRQAYKKHRSLR